MALPVKAFAVGDCDQCGAENIELFVRHGRMSLCKKCAELEANLPKSPAQLQDFSRKTDDQIEVRADLHVAGTVPLIELRAAIEHDESIKREDKEYAFAKEVARRREILNKAIFDQREELVRNENLRRAMDDAIQHSVSKQTDARRREFRNFDVKYPVGKPAPKAVKAAATGDGPSKWRANKAGMELLYATAKKFGVDASTLKMMMEVVRNKPIEDVAKTLARNTGKDE